MEYLAICNGKKWNFSVAFTTIQPVPVDECLVIWYHDPVKEVSIVKDIPVFDTKNGVGSLILKDIAYTQTAYVRIASVSNFAAYLEECIGFCRAVGAETVYATGHEALCSYPYHTSILTMECMRNSLADTDAVLIPVTEESLTKWLAIYRDKMQRIPNAAYLSDAEGRLMLQRGDGYYIYRDQILLGIGIAAGNTIDLVASVQLGGGRHIVLALKKNLTGETILLEVAAENMKAIRLYEELGFKQAAVKSKWYKIF